MAGALLLLGLPRRCTIIKALDEVVRQAKSRPEAIGDLIGGSFSIGNVRRGAACVLVGIE
ncbi:hypothetical protein NKH92_16365 [Mesorhizobium sp. M0871]|uniref:hypothetical protein n=1 Tax=Mesorhizobium sp. M0871 TaxID=2957017 RepID=UPI00333C2396